MIIIGVLLIVAVLLDGYRRMRDPGRIRVSLKQVPTGPEGDDVLMTRELPNGGARVAPRDESAPAPVDTVEAAEPATEDIPEDQEDEPPLLTEPAPPPAPPRPEPLFERPSKRATVESGENLDMLDEGETEAETTAATPFSDEPQEVLMLHVVARDEAGFPGEDILQVLLAYNLRFGELDFFHRHEKSAGKGGIQFSVANMLQPGVFDIDRMADFSTTGMIFFITLPGPKDMMGSFELMLETAQGVAEDLGGDVLDESRSVTTRQTLEHMRQRIRDLERKLLAQAGR
jgi:cell division protein ZipA